MKIRNGFRIGWALGVLAVSGCGSNEGYLFRRVEAPSKKSDVSHKLKQLQGNTLVDILWVIDNSGSMGTHQQNVIRNTQIFMDQFVQGGNPLNWKMGLVSTDTDDAPYVGFDASSQLNSQTPDAALVFQGAVGRLGDTGSYVEEGFAPVLQALRDYPGFLRPRANLAIIFVTDAKEQGRLPLKSVLSELAQLKPLSEVVSYGIFWTTDLGCGPNSEDDWILQGSRYGDFIAETKGKAYPLCTNNFGSNLADLGKDLVSRITSPKLFLETVPRTSTLQVLYKDKPVPSGLPGSGGYWYFDQGLNAIVFHDMSFAPGEDESVRVVYDEDNGQ
ncbi:MAG: hypothetical protein ACK5QT_06805 [Oligoflexia bacterium]